MSNGTIDQIKGAVDLVDLVQEYATDLQGNGVRMKAICPLPGHVEKTGSFTVYPGTGTFKCYGCGGQGDIFSFVGEMEGLPTFSEQLWYLSERTGISVRPMSLEDRAAYERRKLLYPLLSAAAREYHEVLLHAPEGREARAYLTSKGISPAGIERFQLGYAPEGPRHLFNRLATNEEQEELLLEADLIRRTQASGKAGVVDVFQHRIMFPLLDRAQRVVAFAGRRLREGDKGKYVNTGGTPIYTKGDLLFGHAQTSRPQGRANGYQAQGFLLVVEGYTDVIGAHQEGVENVVGLGGTAMTDAQAKLIARMSNHPVLCLDPDPAGIKAMIERAKKLSEYDVYPEVVGIPGRPLVQLDPAEFIAEHGGEAFRRMVGNCREPVFDFHLDELIHSMGNDSPDEQHRVIEEMLPLVAAPRDPTRRALYVARLAERIEAPVDAVHNALAGFSDESSLSHTATPTRRYEEILLNTLFQWPGLRPMVAQSLTVEDFCTPELGAIFDYVLSIDTIPVEVVRVARGTSDGAATLFSQPVTTSLASEVSSYASANYTPIDSNLLVGQLADIVFLQIPRHDPENVDALVRLIKRNKKQQQVARVQGNILEGAGDIVENLEALLLLRQKEDLSSSQGPTEGI